MERIKIGRISYINTLPLFFDILQSPKAPFDLISGVPSEINQAFVAKEVDLALISTYSYLKHKSECDLVPSFCLGSDGAVDSVCLLSTKPIAELNHAMVGITKSSATSQMVLKIILERYFGFQILWQEISPSLGRNSWQKHFDAILLIGDDALSLSKNTAPFWYDIGALWKEKTGVPILFAVLAKQKKVSEQNAEILNEWFQKSLTSFQKNTDPVIDFAKIHSPLNINYQDYFSKLQFVFTQESQHALAVYENHLKDLGAL